VTVSVQLDTFRNAIPGCSLVIFGDLFSQITLCVSSAKKYRQEQLDAYCTSAANLLDGGGANSIAQVLGVPSGKSLSQAIVLHPNEMQVFLRSPFESADVLCCIGPMQKEVGEIATNAGETFQKIAQLK
jgi:hypothetical protein